MNRDLWVVTWRDTATNDDWQFTHEIDGQPVVCHSVGYLLAADDDTLILQATVTEDGEQAKQTIWIPVSSIIDSYELVVDDDADDDEFVCKCNRHPCQCGPHD